MFFSTIALNMTLLTFEDVNVSLDVSGVVSRHRPSEGCIYRVGKPQRGMSSL